MTTLAPEWSGLAERYEAASSEAEREAILAETAQRERAVRARQAAVRKRREDPVTNEWLDAAHAQYMQAEAQCAGKLVRNGSVITDAWALWSGPEWLARKSATEELNNFWDDHPRIPTQTAWREHQGEDVPPDEEISQDREAAVNPLGAAGHIARDAGRAAERSARIAGYQQQTREIAQQKAAEVHAAVAVRAPAALVRTREPIDGAELLGWTRRFLEYHVVWPSPAILTMVTLWSAQSHFRDEDMLPVWQYTPKLAFLSRKPGGGKSFAQRIVSKLVPDGKILLEPSEPAVARKLGRQHQTIFLDEADLLFGTGRRKSAIRAIINSSYEPDGEWSRASGSGESTSDMPVFGQLGFAGLDVLRTGTGDHMNALLDRCLFAYMRKAPEGHRAPRFDAGPRAVAAKLSERLGLWAAQEVRDGIANVIPELPEGLGNRPAGLWEPLKACAAAAGGPWPDMTDEACIELESTGGLPSQDEDDRSMLANYFGKLGQPVTAAGSDEDPYAAEDYDDCSTEEE